MSPDDKQTALDKIAQEIAQTEGGPLKAPGVNPVPGEGNPDAKIMFIGEAPGFNENEQRRPFVGQAGKLLRKNLAANGLSEQEVYITNIVKFRPPDNRDPLPEEIKFFRPFLDRQIEVIDPKVIVTLGRYSMYKFLGEGQSISRIHGSPRTINWQGKKVTIVPMYHPAAALRQGSVLRDFEEDFKKLADPNLGKQSDELPSNTERKVEKPKDQQLELI